MDALKKMGDLLRIRLRKSKINQYELESERSEVLEHFRGEEGQGI